MPKPEDDDRPSRPTGPRRDTGGRQFSQRRDRGSAPRPPQRRSEGGDGRPRRDGNGPRGDGQRGGQSIRGDGRPRRDGNGPRGDGQRGDRQRGGDPRRTEGNSYRSAPSKGRGDSSRGRPGDRADGRQNKGRGQGGGRPTRDGGRGGRPDRPALDGRNRRFANDGPPRRGPGSERKVVLDDDGKPLRSTTLPASDWQPESWVDDGPVRKAATDAAKRGRRNDNRPKKRSKASSAKKAEGALELDRSRLNRELGTVRAARTIQRLGDAADAYGDERFEDARRILRTLAETLPNEPAIRELYGLTLYRLGRWRTAIKELTAFFDQTGSVEQHPVLADCHRALGHFGRVEELWLELGEISPSAAVMAEGRIVRAGALADQGDLVGAIKLIEEGSLGKGGDLRDHHLRLRYVLADLYDRAGDRQAALRHFRTLHDNEPGYVDVVDRLANLS